MASLVSVSIARVSIVWELEALEALVAILWVVTFGPMVLGSSDPIGRGSNPWT